MSLNTTPRTWVAAEKPPAATLNTEIRDALTGIQAAWTSYTPTLTNVTLGTGGTVVGAYMRVGKTIHYRIIITLGTSGAFTGAANATLPVTPLTGGRILHAADASNGSDFAIFTLITAGSATVSFRALPGTAGNALVAVNATVPFTWANTHTLTATGTYEAA